MFLLLMLFTDTWYKRNILNHIVSCFCFRMIERIWTCYKTRVSLKLKQRRIKELAFEMSLILFLIQSLKNFRKFSFRKSFRVGTLDENICLKLSSDFALVVCIRKGLKAVEENGKMYLNYSTFNTGLLFEENFSSERI